MLDVIQMPNLGEFLPLLAMGFVTAAIVGWFAIKWLIADYPCSSRPVPHGSRAAGCRGNVRNASSHLVLRRRRSRRRAKRSRSKWRSSSEVGVGETRRIAG
jgi:hypothetical protein